MSDTNGSGDPMDRVFRDAMQMLKEAPPRLDVSLDEGGVAREIDRGEKGHPDTNGYVVAPGVCSFSKAVARHVVDALASDPRLVGLLLARAMPIVFCTMRGMELLARAQAAGIQISLKNGLPCYTGQPTKEMLEEITRERTALIEALKARATWYG